MSVTPTHRRIMDQDNRTGAEQRPVIDGLARETSTEVDVRPSGDVVSGTLEPAGITAEQREQIDAMTPRRHSDPIMWDDSVSLDNLGFTAPEAAYLRDRIARGWRPDASVPWNSPMPVQARRLHVSRWSQPWPGGLVALIGMSPIFCFGAVRVMEDMAAGMAGEPAVRAFGHMSHWWWLPAIAGIVYSVVVSIVANRHPSTLAYRTWEMWQDAFRDGCVVAPKSGGELGERARSAFRRAVAAVDESGRPDDEVLDDIHLRMSRIAADASRLHAVKKSSDSIVDAERRSRVEETIERARAAVESQVVDLEGLADRLDESVMDVREVIDARRADEVAQHAEQVAGSVGRVVEPTYPEPAPAVPGDGFVPYPRPGTA